MKQNQHKLKAAPSRRLSRLTHKAFYLNRAPLKQIFDAASLAKVILTPISVNRYSTTFNQRWKCFDFYRHADDVQRLHVALPRSGVLWSELGMRLAINLADGKDGEYKFEDDLFWPTGGLAFKRLDWRVPLGISEAEHTRNGINPFGNQLYFHSRLPYFNIRSAGLKDMKIIILTRSILDSVESQIHKQSVLRTQLNGNGGQVDDSFDYMRSVDSCIDFYNSWGDVLTWHPSARLYRYEDLKDNTIELHEEILDFWGFNVPRDCIEEGFRRASKTEMKRRAKTNQPEMEFRAPGANDRERGALPDWQKKSIIDRINQRLVYDLGYQYDYEMQFGKHYD